MKRLWFWIFLIFGMVSLFLQTAHLFADGKNLVGEQAPEIALAEVINFTQPFSLEKAKGKVVLLEFWATWCPPCRESIPHLNKLHNKYKDKGPDSRDAAKKRDFLIISVTAESSATVKGFMKQAPMSFPIGIDKNGTTNRTYGIVSIPTAYLIDPTGKVIWQGHTMQLSEEQIEAALQQVELPAETPSPAAKPTAPTTKPGFAMVAMGAPKPRAIRLDSQGNPFVASFADATIYQVTKDGKLQPFVKGVSQPAGMAFDAAGNLLVANTQTGAISKVTPKGEVSLFAKGLQGPKGLAFDKEGNLFVANSTANTVSIIKSTGEIRSFASGFAGPSALAFNAQGELFVANAFNNTISKVMPDGSVTTFAQGLDTPVDLAISADGKLFVANYKTGVIVCITPDGKLTQVASGVEECTGLSLSPKGELFVTSWKKNAIFKVKLPE